MSMFYELMMRKKEQIMYATIKGTLTENDGVFSGFSASNYLVLQDDITEIPTDFEIQTRISIPATNSGFAIHFLSYLGNSSGIRVFSSGKLNFYSKNNDNNTVEIIGTTVLSLDTFYFIKIKKVGNTITLYSSTDKITWTTEGTTTTTSTIPLTSKIGFGHCGNPNNNNYIFNGSIDLNNSYIKLGSTKYNLQAVVGYTVVGSPTITDGVVSGFSSANYLRLPQISAGTVKSFEISTKFTTGAILSDSTIIGILLSYNYGINLYANGKYLKGRIKIGANYYEVDSALNVVNINTTYYVKFIVDTTVGKEYLKISTDNSNWQIYEKDISTSVIDNSIQWQIGNGSVGVFGGSIDLNNTNIKVNNKLYFNGQQA